MVETHILPVSQAQRIEIPPIFFSSLRFALVNAHNVKQRKLTHTHNGYEENNQHGEGERKRVSER